MLEGGVDGLKGSVLEGLKDNQLKNWTEDVLKLAQETRVSQERLVGTLTGKIAEDELQLAGVPLPGDPQSGVSAASISKARERIVTPKSVKSNSTAPRSEQSD